METGLVIAILVPIVALAMFASVKTDKFRTSALISLGGGVPVGFVVDLLIGGPGLLGALVVPVLAFITFLAIRYGDHDRPSW